MSSIGFGDGVARRQWYLPGIDPALLPHPFANGVPPVADAIEASYSDPTAGTTLFEGRVAVTTASIGGVSGLAFTTSDVANAVLLNDDGLVARFSGFTQVDAELGGNGASVLELIGVQRANLITGAGDDLLRIDTLRTDTRAEDDYRIVSGDGDDVVRIGGAALAGDTSGFGQRSYVLLGAGNDSFLGRNATADDIDGGKGKDTLWGGPGDDTLAGGKGADVFVFLPGDGNDVVRDFADTAGSGPASLTLFFSASPSTPNVTPISGNRYVPDDDYGAPGLDWTNWIISAPFGPLNDRAIQPGSSAGATLAADAPFTLLEFDAEQTSPVGTDNTYLLRGYRDGVEVASTSFSLNATTEHIMLDDSFRHIDTAVLMITSQIGPADTFYIDNLEMIVNDVKPPPEDRLRFPTMTEEEGLAMLAAAVQDGADTLLDTGDGTIRLVGVQASSLGLDDLILG